MFKITITPHFRPRRRYGFWAGEFETVPSINVLRKAIEADAGVMATGLADGSVESTEENLFLSKAVHPKCFLILLTLETKAQKLPKPVEGKMKVHTIISGEKILGSIAIQ